MRTFLIAYDLANPALNKHAVAQSIMTLGERWARPLDSTWYVTSEESEEAIAERLGGLLDNDDGLLVQSVDDQAMLTNTSLRWFRQRSAAEPKPSNVVAFPQPKPLDLPVDDEDEPELPFARAS